MIKYLRVNGILFQELSCSILRLNMQHGSNLTVLEMDSYPDNAYNFFVDILIEMMGSFKSLKEMVICVVPFLKEICVFSICCSRGFLISNVC